MGDDRYHPDALEEQHDAAAFYESREPNLGDRFVEAVEQSITAISTHPEIGPRTPFQVGRWVLRQRLLRTFPFHLIYSVRPTGIRIEAVAHTSRAPGYWRERLDEDDE